MPAKKEFERIVGEVWGRRYSSIGSAQAKEFEHYLKEGSAGDAIWAAQERATASFGEEDVSPFILELLRQADMLSLPLTPDQATYLIIDSLKLPNDEDEEVLQSTRQLLDSLNPGETSESSLSWVVRETPAIPVLELFSFFRSLLDLNRPHTDELVEFLADPDMADELLRSRYLNRPDVIEESGRRVKVEDQPLVGTPRFPLIRAISAYSVPLFVARLLQIFLMAAYGIGNEPRDLKQLLQASSEEQLELVTSGLNHYKIHMLADSLVAGVQKRFYAEKDDKSFGSLTQILVDEIRALPEPIIAEPDLQERIVNACLNSTVNYLRTHKTQFQRDSILRVSNPIIKALEENSSVILEILQTNWSSPYSSAYREIRKAILRIETSQRVSKAETDTPIIGMDFHQERKRVLGSLSTLNKKYSNLVAELLVRRKDDPNNAQRRLAALFACEAFYEHKDPADEGAKWAGLEGLLDYYIALIDSTIQAKEILAGEVME
ncbi:MAG: hypothetical protein ACE5OZ_08600 [Candidatus Heimdallarchaeota archaeon]